MNKEGIVGKIWSFLVAHKKAVIGVWAVAAILYAIFSGGNEAEYLGIDESVGVNDPADIVFDPENQASDGGGKEKISYQDGDVVIIGENFFVDKAVARKRNEVCGRIGNAIKKNDCLDSLSKKRDAIGKVALDERRKMLKSKIGKMDTAEAKTGFNVMMGEMTEEPNDIYACKAKMSNREYVFPRIKCSQEYLPGGAKDIETVAALIKNKYLIPYGYIEEYGGEIHRLITFADKNAAMDYEPHLQTLITLKKIIDINLEKNYFTYYIYEYAGQSIENACGGILYNAKKEGSDLYCNYDQILRVKCGNKNYEIKDNKFKCEDYEK
jgi:hypothetical protein